MRVLLVYFNLDSPISYGSGVGYLSAILKQDGHDTHVLHLNEQTLNEPYIPAVLQTIAEYSPQVVGLSAISSQEKFVRTTLEALQGLEENKPIVVLGGLLATFDPDPFLSRVDFLIRGEGELTLRALIQDLEEGKKPPLKEWIGSFCNLDGLLPMDTAAFEYNKIIAAKEGWAEVMIGRGCPFECSYCFNQEYKRILGAKNYIRLKPVSMTIRELLALKESCPDLRIINFVDDNFTYDFAYLKSFLPQFSNDIGLPFLCASRSEFIDADVAKLLADHGCRMVRMGMESGSDALRRKELNRYSPTRILLHAVEELRSRGIEVGLFNMIGIPGETEEDILGTLKLNARILPATSKRTVLLPFRGTEIYRRWKHAIDEELLSSQSQYNNCQSVFKFGNDWHQMIKHYQDGWAEELSKLAGVKYDFRWEDSVAVREDYPGVQA